MTITQDIVERLRIAARAAQTIEAHGEFSLAADEIERLREALRFYADERRYKSADLSKDRGALARSSLPQPIGTDQ